MKPFSKILVPTDFSENAHVALERALDLRQRFGATVTLFHAFQVPISYPNGYVFTIDIVNAIEENARTQMEKVRELAQGRAAELAGGASVPPISAKVELGAPATAILEEAKRGAYDLVVMGTQGRTGLAHLFIGSVAERVVRAAPCPVLTVRP